MDTLSALAGFRKYAERLLPFTDEEWQEFEKYLSIQTLSKKEHFVKRGEVCDGFGYIAAGSVRYYLIREDGEELTSYFSFSDELVSSYKSFLRQEPSLTCIQALEDVTIVCLTYNGIQALLLHPLLKHKIERFGRLVAEYYICCYEERVQAFIMQSPEQRYKDLLRDGQDIIRRIPQHYIANFLGITPVSLSRIRKRIFTPGN
jgi:CRP-like cAMP-binding protein